jgi:hypothetical protein
VKRILGILAIALAAAAVAAAAGVWNEKFRAPPVERLPIPEGLIAADSAEGRKLLAESRFAADYERLAENFVGQTRAGFCGVATSVIALNALHAPERHLDQASFFTGAASQVRSSLQVTMEGMLLDDFQGLLRAHGVDVTTVYASDSDLDAFRSAAKENLARPGDYLLVNYQLGSLGQGKGGHFSPVAAYHQESDRLLILDVAAHRTPPVWVPTDALWNAMLRVDRPGERERGFVVVRDPERG